MGMLGILSTTQGDLLGNCTMFVVTHFPWQPIYVFLTFSVLGSVIVLETRYLPSFCENKMGSYINFCSKRCVGAYFQGMFHFLLEQ